MLSDEGSVTFAALIASAGLTAQVRTLSDDIALAMDDPTQDWSEDLKALGIIIPTNDDERTAFLKSLGSAFASVASQVSTDGKRGATCRYLPDTGEVAVTFRRVKARAK